MKLTKDQSNILVSRKEELTKKIALYEKAGWFGLVLIVLGVIFGILSIELIAGVILLLYSSSKVSTFKKELNEAEFKLAGEKKKETPVKR